MKNKAVLLFGILILFTLSSTPFLAKVPPAHAKMPPDFPKEKLKILKAIKAKRKKEILKNHKNIKKYRKELRKKVKAAKARAKKRARLGQLKEKSKASLKIKVKTKKEDVLVTEETRYFRLKKGVKTEIKKEDLSIEEQVTIKGGTDEAGNFTAAEVLAKPLTVNVNGFIRRIKGQEIEVEQLRSKKLFTVNLSESKILKYEEGIKEVDFSELSEGGKVKIQATADSPSQTAIEGKSLLLTP